MLALLLGLACTRSPASSPPGGVDTAPDTLELGSGDTRLVYNGDGTIDIFGAAGQLVLRAGTAAVQLDATDDSGPRTTLADGAPLTAAVVDDTLTVVRADDPALTWTIRPRDGGWTFRLDVATAGDDALSVARLSALEVREERGGGLFLGADPATHRILENGSYAALDFVVEILPGDVALRPSYQAIAPGDFAGSSVSDWNHAVVDLEGGAAWVAGALSFTRSMPVMNLSFDRALAPTDEGRLGFTYFSAEAAYQPEPVTVEPGEVLASETFFVDPDPGDPLAGLERYAEVLADALGVVPWHRREEGRRVPNGWNSWSGSGGTGGYGTDIDEDLVLENLDVMATELRDWGMDWFQVDDGYEPAYGDWEWREDRFPHGPAWLAEQIRGAGQRPGLWMAPFTADPDSELAQTHPDWLADKTPLGLLFVGDTEILDLTHPEVKNWLGDLAETVTQDWGFEWYKLDFGYYALFGTGFYEADATREDAWRGAMERMREGLGEDTFLLGIGVLGINYDLCDGFRTTLDNAPVWDWDPDLDADAVLEQQGFKPTVRTAGRRWYLQDRVWVNHPDLLFFRSNTVDSAWPEVSRDEAQALATFVGLSGGIVKLGDRLVDLDASSIDTIRRLLPIYGRAARPVDLFAREFPEVWWLPVEDPLDGYDEEWSLLGLYNWGWNRDLSTNPYTEMADDGALRAHSVDLASLGLDGTWLAYEFWTGTFLGEVEGTLALDVPSHSARVVALRAPLGRPQFIGWNRQITMGAVLLEAVDWDGSELVLTTQVAAPTAKAPFTYDLAFYVPEGFTFRRLSLGGDVTVTESDVVEDGFVLHVSFVPAESGTLTVALQF